MSGFGELYGEFGHTHLYWPHTTNTTQHGGIGSDHSHVLSFPFQENTFSILKSQLKSSVVLKSNLNLNFKDNENIDIFFRYLSFLLPPPVSPICFTFADAICSKETKSQLTVISLAGLRLPFPFLRVFFQLCVMKHKKGVWEGTFRHPRITSFNQFVHGSEEMS